MSDKKFLIASLFVLIGAVIATLVYYHYDSGLFYEDISIEESMELENITKVRFKKISDEGTHPYVVKIWIKDQFKVYKYNASGLDVAFEDTRATTQRISFYQQTTSGILEALLTFGALYVTSVGLATYHFLLVKKQKNQ